MKLEEYKKLTEEERLNLFNELEEEKTFLDKALEKFIDTRKNNGTQEKEKWKNVSFQCDDLPEEIVEKINGE